ncbi:DUF4192 domain-containing protein [Saccharomonospora sp. NPDC046836]|uniref:DUF4192 domain-containing protein n=1 Tax=Saccharomonospora sp. NPDC046836 TaxID=3156921 RepID=UPI0033C673E0
MTTSPTTGATTVDLRAPGQLLAATPHLLGFHPSDSVLVITHTGQAGNQIGHLLRADLPAPGDEFDLALLMRMPVAAQEPSGVTLAVVGGAGAQATGPPHRELMDAMADVLAEVDIPVLHSLWTPEICSGARWQCYDDSSCTGRLPDPRSSVLAAMTAHAGLITYSSRDAMERVLAPADEAALVRRVALLDLAADNTAGEPPASACELEQAYAVVSAALVRADGGDLAFTDREVVDLALALVSAEVRDACLATALPPGSRRAQAAERLWLALVRATPAPERAQVASLLAYSAYVRGEGPLAGMAVANALEADPGHVLAGLLSQALHHSMPPQKLAKLARSCDATALWAPPPQDLDPPPMPDSRPCDPG